MTVASSVKQTLAGLKSAQASFETFALQTENEKQNNCINKQRNKRKRSSI